MTTSISMCMSTNTLMKARTICMNMSTCMPISTSTNTNIPTMAHPRNINMSIWENMVRMTMNIRGMRKNNMTMSLDA